jgi:alkylation response protein AidB-like acyl-CoA dehydrogenase
MAARLTSTIRFSDEQSLLLDTATEFFRDKSPTSAVRERMAQTSGFDESEWREMVDLGWSGLAIPESCGGSGLGLGAAVCIAEPMGRHLFASPWLSTQLFALAVAAGGTERQRNAWLPEIAGGGIATVAVTEPDGNWRLDEPLTEFAREDGTVSTRGVKTLVSDAAAADRILVSGRLDGVPALAVVERGALPAPERETVIDETRRCYRLDFDGVHVGRDALITGPAARIALGALEQAAWLLLAAEAAGGTAGVLALTVDYLNTRTAFGKRIGSYQGLKHPTVDALIGLERARSHVYHAASLLDAGEDAEVGLRMAKAQAGDAFAFAGDRAIQFHGGFGFTWECDAQLYLRRALFLQYAFGDAAHHRRHLGRLLL